MADNPILRIAEQLDDPRHNRAAARDIVSHLQCFGANGEPLFTVEQISMILAKVGAIALQAAEEGDDRRLKRMLDAQIKLATVNQKLMEISAAADETHGILDRLRDRQRAANAG